MRILIGQVDRLKNPLLQQYIDGREPELHDHNLNNIERQTLSIIFNQLNSVKIFAF